MKKDSTIISTCNEFSLSSVKTKRVYKNNHLLCSVSGGQDSIVSFFFLVNFLYLSKNFKLIKSKLSSFSVASKSAEKKRCFDCFFSLKKNKKTNALINTENKLSRLDLVFCQHFWQTQNFFCVEFLFQLTFFFDIPYTFVLSKNILVSENRARGWRKKTFSRLLKIQKLSTIVTGQTKTDTAEKSITNLLRGTSPKSFSLITKANSKTTSSFFCFRLFRPKTFYFTLTGNKQERKVNRRISFSFYRTQKKNSKKLRGTRAPFFSEMASFSAFFGNTFKKKKSSNSFLLYKTRLSFSFCFSGETLEHSINSLKPLQNRNRYHISKLVQFYKFPLTIDATNFSLNFSRNKIRHLFIPFIRFLFKLKFETLLLNFLYLVNLEHEQIENENLELKRVLNFLRINYLKKIFFSSNRRSFFVIQTGHKNNNVFPTTKKEKRWFYCNEIGISKIRKQWKIHEDPILEASLVIYFTSVLTTSRKYSLLQNLLYNYREIEINFRQISKLENSFW
uniref:tRNA(Ile)-lysidine synthase n=1 Tax=Chlorella vulgaris TaxID=3077 RepID=A0A650ANG0_CHLVU|nr:hypothetical protein [Chlorella vulgaris]